MWGGEVKRGDTFSHVTVTSILKKDLKQRNGDVGRKTMVERRIKPHLEQVAEVARRAEQRRLYRRNQVFGLLIVAGVILAWWLFHTNPRWIFPPGWWRP